MMGKISITAPDTTDVYKWLQLQGRNCVANAPVAWNFNKYLIDEAGNWIAHYSSPVSPLNQNIINWILSPNTTGINSDQNENGVTLLSNPANDFIRLNIETHEKGDVKIKLFDMKGRLTADVFTGNLDGVKEIAFPTDNVPNGIYILQAVSGTLNKSFKVAVIR